MNKTRIRRYLQQFDFQSLFIEELGWDNFTTDLNLTLDGTPVTLQAIAEKRGMVLLQHQAAGEIPPAPLRNKIELLVSQKYREHFIIFTDGNQTEQKWLWVRRELGRPLARRDHTYRPQTQTGDALIQKLETIAFSFEEEEDLTLVDVTSRVRAAFNVERATKKFYDQFKKERGAFEAFVQGIPDVDMSKWYVSVMLNRLMFVYFIQRKGFLDGDTGYLRNRMQLMQERYGGDQFYSFYRYFLLRLFHEGLGEPDHDDELEGLIGNVPYLNGGIFQLHEVEQKYPDIQISDAAFTRIFDFFDQYQWHLDDRPLRDDKEINPDVLGYIFEKYINQKQMGAYYTKEDITEYISKNTILPFLFDQAVPDPTGFQNLSTLWQSDPDRYIYAAVRKGTELPLPVEIAVGVDDVAQRQQWNTPTPDEYALPTEIWRETVARRQRYEDIWLKLVEGEVTSINDFITYNLDIQQLAQDVVENCAGPELLRAFWKALNQVSVLDPTCGSGAFLFAALNILQPLYEACLERMEAFVEELEADAHPQKYGDFKQVLAQVAQHPNQTYYVLKSIVVNNLYGVDIMAEAVEIAKLRLFLKLVAQVETVDQIEPLPDIDFNIRAGNTLVGFTSKEEVAKAMQTTQAGQGRLMFGEDQAALARIEEKAGDVDRLFSRFREMQTSGDLHEFDAADFVETKKRLQERLRELEAELNRYLAQQYGVNPDNKQAYQKWLVSHQPFHWFVEFYGILKQSGFDVIIGNPPYVEYKNIQNDYKVLNYVTFDCKNLFAYLLEKCSQLGSADSKIGMIIPLSAFSTDRMIPLISFFKDRSKSLHISNFSWRPGKLFDGVNLQLSIVLQTLGSQKPILMATNYVLWESRARPFVFTSNLEYEIVTDNRLPGAIPKLGSILAKNILTKLRSYGHEIGGCLVKKSQNLVYYRRGGLYWKVFVDFETGSSEEKILRLHPQVDKYAIIGALSSNLWFWYLMLTSDCRHLGNRDIATFPFDPRLMKPPFYRDLSRLGKLYVEDLKANSENTVRVYKGKKAVKVISFKVKMSKSIIDQIDTLLAKHYSFTDEELDFIINYDIKYRMGDDLFANDGEGA